MTERERTSSKAQSFFDDLWARGDPWELETSDYERARYARLLAVLDQPRYPRILEIGCGAGVFTPMLAPFAQRLLALDVSANAISKAQAALPTSGTIEFRVANIMEFDLQREGPWDLIVMSETIYCLGWLYTFFDVSWFASRLFEATAPDGQLLLANTQSGLNDPLLLPWIIRTYRDLFLNVGYRLQKEEAFRAQKNGVDFDVLISLFCRARTIASDSGSSGA